MWSLSEIVDRSLSINIFVRSGFIDVTSRPLFLRCIALVEQFLLEVAVNIVNGALLCVVEVYDESAEHWVRHQEVRQFRDLSRF